MSGLDNVESISGGFEENAGRVVFQVSDMEIDGSMLVFDVDNALSKADQFDNASTIVVTEDKAAFLKDQSSCTSVSISRDDLSKEGFNPFTGTASVGVSGLSASKIQEAANGGCAIAKIEPEQPIQVASLDM